MLHEDSHLSDPELLGAADGELPARRQRQVRAHLQACWTCRTRMAELESTIANFATGYRSVLDRQLPPAGAAVARFRARLSQHVPPAVNHGSVFSRETILPWIWAALAPVLLCLLFLAGTFSGGKMFSSSGEQQMVSRLETVIVPDPRLTPGEATFASKSEICQENLPAGQRQIPEAVRQAVLAEYGVKGVPQDAYEVDFLITPELGGSASIRNLWPQSYFSRKWNAHVKDVLEERLHQLVCSGDLDLSTAQRDIAANWVDAYKKYVRTDNPM